MSKAKTIQAAVDAIIDIHEQFPAGFPVVLKKNVKYKKVTYKAGLKGTVVAVYNIASILVEFPKVAGFIPIGRSKLARVEP